MSPTIRLRSLLLAAALLPAAPLPAQNLVQNGQFDAGLGRWFRGNSENIRVSWSPRDAGALPDSGSVQLTEVATTPGTYGGLFQCSPVQPGLSYLAQARVWADAQPTSGSVALVIGWFGSFDCANGSHISDVTATLTPPAGVWSTLTLPDLTAPANGTHAGVEIFVSKDSASGTYAANFDDVALLPTTTTLTVPASASIHGQGATPTFFQTDLWVMNNSATKTATVTARHRCFPTQTCGSGTKTLLIPPRGAVLRTDVIGTFFGDPESSGAIELAYDPTNASISALSRTYTPSFPAPSYGTGIPALPPEAAQTRSLFLGLGNSGGDLTTGFRSNVGGYNPNPDPVTFTVTLYDAGGAMLGSPFSGTLGPYEPNQINVFKATGNESLVTRDAYLVVTATAPIFAYVTVNDNQSGDQIYLRAALDHPPL